MESNETQLHYEIALSRIEGVGSVIFKSLIAHLGSAENVFKTPKAKLLKISGIGKNLIESISISQNLLIEADTILNDSLKHNIEVLSITHPKYPSKLKDVFDSPPILYSKGKGEVQNHKTLAIVGTRKASEYGIKVVNELISNLKDVQIISGMALGIDIAAHKAALKNNLSTLAVLANGLDQVYPSTHKKVCDELMETGLLFSEQPVFSKLHPQFFISRNRIIAALAEVTLVVESSSKGGSLVTAEYANNYNRDVFAVPGDIYRSQSAGTNRLIFDNKANIYTSPENFIDWMDWKSENKTEVPKKNIDLSNFSEEEKQVILLLQNKKEMLIDDISWNTQMSLNKLSSILLNLEFQDIIKQIPGKKFMMKN